MPRGQRGAPGDEDGRRSLVAEEKKENPLEEQAMELMELMEGMFKKMAEEFKLEMNGRRGEPTMVRRSSAFGRM